MLSHSKAAIILVRCHNRIQRRFYWHKCWGSQCSKDVDLLKRVQKGTIKMTGVMEQFSYTKKGWKSWDTSPWRWESSGETLEQPSSIQKAPTRKLDRDFFQGYGWYVKRQYNYFELKGGRFRLDTRKKKHIVTITTV